MSDDMIPRAEANAMVAAALMEAADKIAWEYNTTENGQLKWACREVLALIEAPADAALARMLAEARAKGMEEAAKIAQDYDVWHHPLSDYEAHVMKEHGKRAASHIQTQILAAAVEVRESKS